jgi:signal peptidase I
MQPEQPSPQPATPTKSQPNAFTRGTRAFFDNWFVSWLLIPAIIVAGLHFYVFSAFHVVGTSMLPTLHNSDYLIVSEVDRSVAHLEHRDYIPGRDQIIVFHYPKDPSLDFVKRVIALPGERVTVEDCKVTVYNAQHPNGFNPDADHAINGTCTDNGDGSSAAIDETVPAGNLFVLGDNRTPGGSDDSRDWGFLPSYDIIGNAVLRLYPFTDLRAFHFTPTGR